MTEISSPVLKAMVFFSFFVYPAIFTIGNNSGVLPIQLVALLILVVTWPFVLKTRAMAPLGVWLIVSLVAAIANISGASDPATLAGKSVGATFLNFAPALAIVGIRASRRKSGLKPVDLITPIAWAIIIHAGFGLVQFLEFRHGSFPLLSLFHNRSFADIQSINTDYVTYIHRPFGIFPEPSAMAASLGPFLLLIFDRLTSVSRPRPLDLIAFATGSALMLISASVFNLAYWPLVVLMILRRRRLYISEIAVGGALLAGFIWVAGSITRDVTGVGANASFQGRLQSIWDGLSLLTSTAHGLAVGYGPASSVSALQQHGYQSVAIYSIAVTQLAELGLLAILVWLSLGRALRGQVGRGWPPMVGWIVAVVGVTGYTALLPIWVFVLLISDGWLHELNAEVVTDESADGSQGSDGDVAPKPVQSQAYA